MVALVVVLEQHLPVRRHLVVVPGAQVQPLGRVRPDHVVEGAEVVLERHRGTAAQVAGCVHEQPAAPASQRQLHQPVRGRVERGVVPEPGGGAQRPVDRVGPRVVRADQRPVRAAGAVREQLVAAVPAGVRERPRRRLRVRGRVRVPEQEHRDAAHRGGALAHPVGPQVGVAADAAPGAGEQVPALPRQHPRVGVRGGRQGAGRSEGEQAAGEGLGIQQTLGKRLGRGRRHGGLRSCAAARAGRSGRLPCAARGRRGGGSAARSRPGCAR